MITKNEFRAIMLGLYDAKVTYDWSAFLAMADIAEEYGDAYLGRCFRRYAGELPTMPANEREVCFREIGTLWRMVAALVDPRWFPCKESVK